VRLNKIRSTVLTSRKQLTLGRYPKQGFNW